MPGHIILDFDGTITTKDTIGNLAGYALAFQRARGIVPTPTWEDIVKAYTNDYNAHVAAWGPEASRTTLWDELAFLRSLRDVEARSTARVRDSGLFRGIAPSDLFAAGKEAVLNGAVQLRPGFHEFVDAMVQSGRRVSVLSVNWSVSFVLGVIGLAEVAVVANEIKESGRIVGPALGGAEPRSVMATYEDKLEVLQILTNTLGSGEEEFIYFGDSLTDLGCLVASSGVVIADGPESGMLRCLARIGFVLRHVSEPTEVTGEKDLVWAKNFFEFLRHGKLNTRQGRADDARGTA